MSQFKYVIPLQFLKGRIERLEVVKESNKMATVRPSQTEQPTRNSHPPNRPHYQQTPANRDHGSRRGRHSSGYRQAAGGNTLSFHIAGPPPPLATPLADSRLHRPQVMRPLKLPPVDLPKQTIHYPPSWLGGDIHIYSRLPMNMRLPFKHHLERSGWRMNLDAPTTVPSEICIVNGSAFVHTDSDYGIVAIALIDSTGETELVTRYGGTRMTVGDVVVFDANKWHAWISHGPCALASICVAPITPPQEN